MTVTTNLGEFWRWLTGDGELFLRLLAAALLGGMIGMERGAHGRSAGLRTQMLVAVGSALAMIVSLHFAEVYGAAGGSVRVDPARTAYGVMAGVGFLGAGAIMRYGIDIRGMTTAASLWCTAALGLATGFGMYHVAIAATGLVLIILAVVRAIDNHLPHPSDRELSITFSGDPAAGDAAVRKALCGSGVKAVNTGVLADKRTDSTRIDYLVKMKRSADPTELVELLRSMPTILEIKLN